MATQRQINKLDDLMDGGVTERFNHELGKVLENIYNPNTDPKKARSITLTFTFKPNEHRDASDFVSSVTSKLAPFMPLTKTIFITQADDGTVTATEMTNQVPGQISMDGEVNIPRIVEFSKE